MRLYNRLTGRKFLRDTLMLGAGKLVITALSLLSTLVVTRVLGPSQYGVYALADSMVALVALVDISGAGTVTSLLMARAIGAGDAREAQRALAYGIQASLTMRLLIIVILFVFGGAIAAYAGATGAILTLAVGIALAGPADVLYSQLLLALQARRSMAIASAMQVVNQTVLTVLMIGAVLVQADAASLVVARVAYSYITLVMMAALYIHQRSRDAFVLPAILPTFRLALTQSPRPYWGVGALSAIDRSVSGLYSPLVTLLVGAFGGSLAAGYLSLGMRALAQVSVFGAAVLENLNAAVPQAVGRGDMVALRHNFGQLQRAVTAASVLLYGAMAVTAPLLVPLLFGADWKPAVPVIIALAALGVITTIGGNYAPLYRSFNLQGRVILLKLAALALTLPAVIWLIQAGAQGVLLNQALLLGTALARSGLSAGVSASTAAAVAGAIGLDVMFAASVGVTAWLTLRALRRAANAP